MQGRSGKVWDIVGLGGFLGAVVVKDWEMWVMYGKWMVWLSRRRSYGDVGARVVSMARAGLCAGLRI